MCMASAPSFASWAPPPARDPEEMPPFPEQAPPKTLEEHKAKYKDQRPDNTPAFRDPYTSLLNPKRMEERPAGYKPMTLMQDWEQRKKTWEAGGWKKRVHDFNDSQDSTLG